MGWTSWLGKYEQAITNTAGVSAMALSGVAAAHPFATQVATGALAGAGLGAIGSLFSDSSSMLGGALAGGLFVGGRGASRIGAAAGAAYGATLGDGVGSGALMGFGLGHYGGRAIGNYGASKGGLRGAGIAALATGRRMGRDAVAAGRYIGSTAESGYNTFKAIWSSRRQSIP